MKHKGNGRHRHRSLAIVHKFFPSVTDIVDAERPQIIEVTAKDAQSASVRDHNGCALAVACKRAMHLDGVIIARSVAYLIKGHHAQRFLLPHSIGREIVSFDRGAGFAPGTYQLIKVTANHLLGSRMTSGGQRAHSGRKIQLRHLTTNIRTVLGGQEAD